MNYLQFYALFLSVHTGHISERTTQLDGNSLKSNPTTTHQISPELVNELKDFIELIPTATVDEIVAKHLIIDGGFRRAVKYLRSSEFKQLLQQLLELPDVIEILDYLHCIEEEEEQPKHTRYIVRKPQLVATTNKMETVADTDMFDVRFVPWRHGGVRVGGDVGGGNGGGGVRGVGGGRVRKLQLFDYLYDVRTFSSFVDELLEHLPRDKYIQMINEKRQQSSIFALFYTALRSAELQPMVEQAMQSTDLARIIKTLNDNSIDAKTLKTTAFEVISWGPAI